MSWHVVNSNDVRKADSNLKEPEIETITRVGQCLSREFLRCLAGSRVVIFVGPGNNGNDGLSLAHSLLNYGYDVKVCNLFPTVINDLRVRLLDRIPSENILHFEQISNIGNFDYCVCVDAIFGIGQRAPLPDKVIDCLKIISEFPVKFAIDVPTGIDGDTGEILYELQWSKTLFVQALKQGLVFGKPSVLAGEKISVDCGIPLISYRSRYYMSGYDFKAKPFRKPYGHKYDYGPVGVIAGCDSMFGAAIFAATGAVCAGGSFVKLCSKTTRAFVPFGICNSVNTFSQDNLLGCNLAKVKSIVFGPGVDSFEEDVFDFLLNLNKPVVVDAGALVRTLPKLNENFILTPHTGEFERLSGETGNSGARLSLFEKMQETKSKLNCNILLKGPSLIYFGNEGNPDDPNESFVYEIQSSKLSFGGVGDFLSGLIAGFLAQGFSTRDACMAACYLLNEAAQHTDWGLDGIISSCRKNVTTLLSDYCG